MMKVIIIVSWLSMCVVLVSSASSSRLPATVYSSPDSSGSTCPSQDTINEEHRRAREFALNLYNRTLPCSCGGAGDWTRVAYLDREDTNTHNPSRSCPSAWETTNATVRACRRHISNACDSVFYSTSGKRYSQVCGPS